MCVREGGLELTGTGKAEFGAMKIDMSAFTVIDCSIDEHRSDGLTAGGNS